MIMDIFDDRNILFHLNWVSKSSPAGQNRTCAHIFAENDKEIRGMLEEEIGLLYTPYFQNEHDGDAQADLCAKKGPQCRDNRGHITRQALLGQLH